MDQIGCQPDDSMSEAINSHSIVRNLPVLCSYRYVAREMGRHSGVFVSEEVQDLNSSEDTVRVLNLCQLLSLTGLSYVCSFHSQDFKFAVM